MEGYDNCEFIEIDSDLLELILEDSKKKPKLFKRIMLAIKRLFKKY